MADRHVAHLLIGGGLAARQLRALAARGGRRGRGSCSSGREPDPPYNRPPCSKGYLQGKESREDTYFRPDEWWEEQRIELRTRTSVMKLDTAAERGDAVDARRSSRYDKALLATGANVRRLHVEGAELDGIHYLRALGNADHIRADADGRARRADRRLLHRLRGRGVADGGRPARCAIVMQEDVTLERGVRRRRPAASSRTCLEEHGVEVHGERRAGALRGRGRAGHAGRHRERAAAGRRRVVIGAGVMPDTMLARAAGLELDEERGGVAAATRGCATAAPGVWAAGDVAEYDEPSARPARSASSTGTWPSTTARRRR